VTIKPVAIGVIFIITFLHKFRENRINICRKIVKMTLIFASRRYSFTCVAFPFSELPVRHRYYERYSSYFHPSKYSEQHYLTGTCVSILTKEQKLKGEANNLKSHQSGPLLQRVCISF
jgi:hypothetical protein